MELLISLSVVAILLVVAVPLGRDFLVKNTLATQTEEIVSALHYARHQATLSGEVLTLTHQSAGWSSGMCLFLDKNNDKTYSEHIDTLLFQWQWNSPDISLHWQGLYSDEYLRFSPTGLNNALSGTFYVCPLNVNSVKGKNIIMNRLGRIRVEDNSETCHT